MRIVQICVLIMVLLCSIDIQAMWW